MLLELRAIEKAWGSRLGAIDSDSFVQHAAAYADQLAVLGRVLALDERLGALKESLDGPHPITRPSNWTAWPDVENIARGLTTELENRELAKVKQAIAVALGAIGDDNHPVTAELRRAIGDRNSEDYRAALEMLGQARALASQSRRRHDLVGALSHLPRLLAALPVSADELWWERSETFHLAWSWRFADSTLHKLLDPNEPVRVTAELDDLERRERLTLLDLTAELAWSAMFRGLSDQQEQALTAWTQAVKKIGRGTGKYAEQHRRTARTYMSMARDAIPAWIMPTYRVAESLEAEPELFDVVIVDEASQSSVESLFLFYIAKQVVVVGDDQQIAPEAVGIDMTEVGRLQRQHLEGLPFGALYSPTSSLFDQAAIRFSNRVVLREHFRCMPEIIEFSNRIAYRDKSLWPLRQYGADRLDPIKTVYLEHGYREGARSAINRPEAEEIVTRIEKLCSDPRYNDKTIGVISLQGEAQAHLIDQMLLERLGPQVMSERSLICGDAYAFQGDERNVIFLSMVAAPNERIGALSNAQALRRFNVAGSRAMDQVWLIHSVRPSDLGSTDMRKELLEYYLDPDVEHWEELASFDESVVNEPFESRFEQDVYIRLRERGFTVSPQVRAGGYRIDLVVNGSGAKLAVECDGDQWHGSDRWEQDSLRQRRLERAGWRFARVRGSDFYRDPDSALATVWEACDRLGIESGSPINGDIRTAEPPITGPASEELNRFVGEIEPEGESDRVESSEQDQPVESSALVETEEGGERHRETEGFIDRSETNDSQSPVDALFPAGPSERGTRLLPETEARREDPPPRMNVEDHQDEATLDPVKDEDRIEMALGKLVYHPRLGEGRVTGVSHIQHPDEPWVGIQFANERFVYTPNEYLRAGFQERKPDADPEPHSSADSDDLENTQAPVARGHLIAKSAPVPPQGLAPYPTWQGSGLPDPRTTARSEVADYLLPIIEAEGPVTADRLYKLYVRATGGVRVTKQARHPLNRALFHLTGKVKIDEFNSPETNWPQRVARLPDQEVVVVRSLGDRDLYEVPLNEIAELIRIKRTSRPTMRDQALMRYVLDEYGLVRLTDKVKGYLQAAIDLLDEVEKWWNVTEN